jgi:hypothetical protein
MSYEPLTDVAGLGEQKTNLPDLSHLKKSIPAVA